jgi:hypothetical protein
MEEPLRAATKIAVTQMVVENMEILMMTTMKANQAHPIHPLAVARNQNLELEVALLKARRS